MTKARVALRRLPAKPAYSVPTMREIRELPHNGRYVVSTFAGCGGSSLGYRMAGFRVLWANEFIEAARETYRANASPQTILDGRDIREVDARDILDATGLEVGQLDVLDGSPPCASFSTVGKREAGWGSVKKYSDGAQRADDLFFEFARLVAGLMPRVFVAENVAGLVRGTAKGYFLDILRALKSPGYRVAARLVDAQWLGVPQGRKRTIFVGVRDDLGLDPVHPSPLPYRYSLRDAIPWLQLPSPYPVEPEADISGYAIGREWHNIKWGEVSDRYLSLVKCHPERPSYTITASIGSTSTAAPVHPYEVRKFSVAELKRICGFPDDFALTGTYAQQCERLGRSVPPVMMAAIAAAVRDNIFGRMP